MTTTMTLGNPATAFFSPAVHQHAQHEIPSDLDLEGGTITNIESSEEIDPSDNCKVQITRYHILSADGMEESTITKRRKLRVNCTQSTRRIEFANGKEAKFEEKTTVLGNLDILNAVNDRNPAALLAIQDGYPQDVDINEMLLRTQDTFMVLLHQKKDELVNTFPDLFSNLRSQPELFGNPTTTFQEIVNADGSKTIKTKSSKAFSSHFVREATYVNGELSKRFVYGFSTFLFRLFSKCKFRAFMEYAGPEGGFRIKLNDRADEDLSEEENDTDEDSSSLISSRLNRSRISELPDSSSELLIAQPARVPQILSHAPMQRLEKAWHAVNELVASEERYVQKLGLLEKFRLEVEGEKLLDKKQNGMLFANLASLYTFHNDHLLPQLMDRRRDWQATKKISDVMRKQGPFLKMYSEYTNNYKLATQMFEKYREKRRFDDIVRKLEKLPECENLSLISHLICPVQRVMRYQLLLKEYLKYLNSNDNDYDDTKVALELVVDAAGHANEMMRKLDRYRNVLEVQEQLGNSIALVSPSRELLRRVKLMKISSSTNRTEERVLFVFNDLILLVSERAIGIGGKYKLRAIFDPFFTQICEGDNLEREHSFYLRGSDSQSGPSRCVELYCANQNEKADLIDTIWAIINETHQRKASFSTSPSIQSMTSPTNERKCCASCEVEFSWYNRNGIQCAQCQRRFCKKCLGQFREQKQRRYCNDCMNNGTVNTNFKGGPSRQNLLALPAQDDNIIKSSAVQLKSVGGRVLNRYFVLRKNFCLYSYNNEKDEMALCMLPISGCEIVPLNEKLSFTIRHMNRTYSIQVFNDSDRAEWIAALLLCASAQIPTQKLSN
ncbi:FYVE, RhoGEF and PH domain-containing protein 4 [Aphelenchoides besseyi]|nr:FYVE, RhoGEF and PH domain-containing protein 4 [Aphelenchoides besseyi]